MSKPFQKKVFFLRTLLVPGSCQTLLIFYNVVTIIVTACFFMVAAIVLLTQQQNGPWFTIVIAVGFLVFLFLFFIGFWVSNKIAGPIFRLEQHMKSIVDGEPVTPFQIRSKDQLQATIATYNALLAKLAPDGEVKE